MKSGSESNRHPKPASYENLGQILGRAFDRMVGRPQRYIDDAVVSAACNDPVRKRNRDIVGVNDIGAARGDGQFFFF